MASPNGNLLAGTANISVDGTNYRLAADAAYKVAIVKRETLTGMDGVHGFKETPIAGFIKLKLRDSGDLTVADFNAMTDVDVVLELANGKTVTGYSMWSVGDGEEVEATEATFDVQFESNNVSED
jgi:hypothetical protein